VKRQGWLGGWLSGNTEAGLTIMNVIEGDNDPRWDVFGGYANEIDDGLVRWAAHDLGLVLEIVRRNADANGFQVLPRRWVIERTFG
jgi:hypothetical protein